MSLIDRFTKLLLLMLSLFVSLTLRAPDAGAQMMVIEFSDSHSAYDHLPNFLRSIDALKSDYIARNPGGKVVIVVNGDFGGKSRWSNERGWLGMQALKTLSIETSMVYVLGNHDAFDWGESENGNLLAEKQIAFLDAAGVRILGSNITFTGPVARHVKDHFDLHTTANRLVRFVGYGLEIFFKKSNWDPRAKTKVLSGISETVATLKSDLAAAAQARVDDLIFFQHDGHNEVATKLARIQSEVHEPGMPSLPAAFAAHDHLQVARKVGSTFVFDSGSDFEFSTVELSPRGEVESHAFYNHEAQAKIAKPARSQRVERLASSVDAWVDARVKLSAKVLGLSGGINETKLDLKSGRALLGTTLAESLRAWGQDKQGSAAEPLPVVAFYNSSSYRRDQPVASGELTVGLFESFYPFLGKVKMFTATGAEVQEIFAELREWRLKQDGSYTPQMSANLAETNGLRLLVEGQPIEPDRRYKLVLDPWLSINGYKIQSLERFLIAHPPDATSTATEIFVGYGAAVISGFAPPVPRACAEIFTRK